MARARQVFLLADSAKAGKVAFAQAGDMKAIDVLITDNGLDEPTLEALEGLSVKVVRV